MRVNSGFKWESKCCMSAQGSVPPSGMDADLNRGLLSLAISLDESLTPNLLNTEAADLKSFSLSTWAMSRILTIKVGGGGVRTLAWFPFWKCCESVARCRHGIVCDCYAKERWVGALGVWGGGVNKVHCVLLSESVATLKMLLCLQVIATLTWVMVKIGLVSILSYEPWSAIDWKSTARWNPRTPTRHLCGDEEKKEQRFQSPKFWHVTQIQNLAPSYSCQWIDIMPSIETRIPMGTPNATHVRPNQQQQSILFQTDAVSTYPRNLHDLKTLHAWHNSKTCDHYKTHLTSEQYTLIQNHWLARFLQTSPRCTCAVVPWTHTRHFVFSFFSSSFKVPQPFSRFSKLSAAALHSFWFSPTVMRCAWNPELL